MANFAVVVDPDPSRRAAARVLLLQRLAPFAYLETQSIEMGDVLLAWALAPKAPRRLIEREGDAVLVLGHAVGSGEPAAPLNDVGGGPMADGFHITIRVTRSGAVSVSPDLLGLFPVYFANPDGRSFLVGSSPYLFRCHPDFRTELEPRAVAALLWANTMVSGRSLYRGVRRLRPGHALQYSGGQPSEVPFYRIPVTGQLHRVPAAECSALLGDALEDACRRHLPPGSPFSLLLSGGLDSRILAATLAPRHPDLLALTFGIRGDLEANYAGRVCQTLKLRHRVFEPGWVPEGFAMTLRWDSLPASPGTGTLWTLPATFRSFAPRLVSGYVMDAIIGGYFVDLSYNPISRVSGFQQLLPYMARWGIGRENLKQLLRPDVFGEALEEVEGELAADYAAQGENDQERAYRFMMAHRMRYHTGTPLWRHGFGAWPVVPFIDRSVFEVAGACPPSLLAGRRLQQALLLQRHPALATIPLDRNSYDDRALDPRLRDLVAHEVREQAVRMLTRMSGGMWHRRERRQYHRSYNFNGPAWRWIRNSVEPDRELAYQIFDRQTFDRLVPPPDAIWPGENSIEDAAGMKSLIGIVAWLREFAPGITRP